jgi:hypothetical protein
LALVLKGGGEVDVAAGVTAAVSGAHVGLDGIPQKLRRNVMYSESLLEVADRLFDLKLSRAPVLTTAFATVRR